MCNQQCLHPNVFSYLFLLCLIHGSMLKWRISLFIQLSIAELHHLLSMKSQLNIWLMPNHPTPVFQNQDYIKTFRRKKKKWTVVFFYVTWGSFCNFFFLFCWDDISLKVFGVKENWKYSLWPACAYRQSSCIIVVLV